MGVGEASGSGRVTEACHKVKSGIGDGWACRTHNRPWPCSAAEQLGDQLALLGQVAPLAPAVIAEVIAERRYALDLHPPSEDDRQDAFSWLDTLAAYLERLQVEAHDLTTQEMLEGGVSLGRYRHRLVQTAGIAVAAVESIDRLTKGE